MSRDRGRAASRAAAAGLVAVLLILSPSQGAAGSKHKPRRADAVVQPDRAPPPDLVAPDVALDKDLSKELARGSLIGQLESKGKLTRNFYTPPPKLMQPYQSAALGSAVAFEIVENGRPFVYAPRAQAYAQQVVDRLLATLPGPPLTIPVRIVANPYYGAAATETGMIVVNLGTFNADPTKGAATTDELALLLGHEVGHILLGHFTGDKAVRTLTQLLKYTASATLAYSSVKGGRFVNGKFQGNGDRDLMLKGLLAGLASSTLVQDLLAPSFSRGRELEADRIGIDLARRAKYLVAEGEVLRFVSRHAEDPLRRSRRVEALRLVVNAMMAQVAARTSKEAGGQNGGLLKDLISVSSQALSEQVVQLVLKQTKDHPDPQERQAFASQYVRQYYKDAGVSPDGSLIRRDSAGIRSLCQDAALAALLDQVQRAIQIRDALAQVTPVEDPAAEMQNVRAALKQAGVATAREPRAAAAPTAKKAAAAKREAAVAARPSTGGFSAADAAAVTWEIKGALLLIDGTTGDAQEAWRRGLRSDFASVDMAQDIDGTISGDGAVAERDTIVARYAKLVGTTDPVLDLVVSSAKARNDLVAAELAAARCSTHANGQLYPQCAAALGYDPMAKGQSAQTPEGRKAFAGKGIEKSFRSLKSLTGIFD